MILESAGEMARVLVRRAFFFGVLFAVLLSPPAWAQQKVTQDKGITVGRQGTRAPSAEKTLPVAPQGPAPCDGNNYTTNAFNNNTLMGGPLVAIAWTPSASVTISRIEVFTGESTAPIALAIWSDDGGSPSKPLADLGDTGYFPLPSTVDSWQGGNLLSPVTVNAATKYWVVFDPTGGEQAPVQNGVGQQYWGSYTGTITSVPSASWFGPFSSSDHAWKFRMFCQKPGGKDVYAVKFLCGSLLPKPSIPPQDGVEWPVKPGNYFTAINVHNPNGSLISFRKKAVLMYRADKPPAPEQPMPPGDLVSAELSPDYGLEIDCADIRNRLLHGAAQAPIFVKGWVVIEVTGNAVDPDPLQLDVTAVYTSHGWDQSGKVPIYVGFAEDVVQVLPKRVK